MGFNSVFKGLNLQHVSFSKLSFFVKRHQL